MTVMVSPPYGGASVLVLRVRVRPVIEQESNHFQMTPKSRPEQSSSLTLAIILRSADEIRIRASIQEHRGKFQVTHIRGNLQWGVTPPATPIDRHSGIEQPGYILRVTCPSETDNGRAFVISFIIRVITVPKRNSLRERGGRPGDRSDEDCKRERVQPVHFLHRVRSHVSYLRYDGCRHSLHVRSRGSCTHWSSRGSAPRGSGPKRFVPRLPETSIRTKTSSTPAAETTKENRKRLLAPMATPKPYAPTQRP